MRKRKRMTKIKKKVKIKNRITIIIRKNELFHRNNYGPKICN